MVWEPVVTLTVVELVGSMVLSIVSLASTMYDDSWRPNINNWSPGAAW